MPFALHPRYKQASNSTHVFFLTGPFSNWHPSRFDASLPGMVTLRRGGVFRYYCNEQYMMAAKAALFGDAVALDRILALRPIAGHGASGERFETLMSTSRERRRAWLTLPRACKEAGRGVQGFDVKVWNALARDIVFEGALAKFGQNSHRATLLDDTGNKILVEGSVSDTIWGVGLAWDDPRIEDPANWAGTNWLGEATMRVRDALRAEKQFATAVIDRSGAG